MQDLSGTALDGYFAGISKFGTHSVGNGASKAFTGGDIGKSISGEFTVESFFYQFNESDMLIDGASAQLHLTNSINDSMGGGVQWNPVIGFQAFINYGFGSYAYSSVLPSIADGQWHHLRVSWDGSTIRVFVNGITSFSYARTTPITTALNLFSFRGGGGGEGSEYGIEMDEVLLFRGKTTSSFTPRTSQYS